MWFYFAEEARRKGRGPGVTASKGTSLSSPLARLYICNIFGGQQRVSSCVCVLWE